MELNTKYEIMVDPNEISGTGVSELWDYLKREALPIPSSDVSMAKWVLQHGQYRGKLPNRLGGFYKEKYNIKLTSYQRQMIGNIARGYTLPDAKYTFDFVDKFDWEDGDFGDRGSCFWGDNDPARGVLEEEGALAIRFYMDGDNGRAWIYKWSDETWVLFNAYGLGSRGAARVLTGFLTRDTGKQWGCKDLDDLTVSGKRAGLVYLNACPQIIFVEGSAPPSNIDLDWPRYKSCDHCEEWTLDEHMYDVDGDMICDDCIGSYTPCNRCGEYYEDDSIRELDKKYYCVVCYKERVAEIEEEFELECLEIKRDTARVIGEAEQFLVSLTYDEQLAAGQLQFEFMYTGYLDIGQYTAIDYAHLEGMMAERLAILSSQPYHLGEDIHARECDKVIVGEICRAIGCRQL